MNLNMLSKCFRVLVPVVWRLFTPARPRRPRPAEASALARDHIPPAAISSRLFDFEDYLLRFKLLVFLNVHVLFGIIAGGII